MDREHGFVSHFKTRREIACHANVSDCALTIASLRAAPPDNDHECVI